MHAIKSTLGNMLITALLALTLMLGAVSIAGAQTTTPGGGGGGVTPGAPNTGVGGEAQVIVLGATALLALLGAGYVLVRRPQLEK